MPFAEAIAEIPPEDAGVALGDKKAAEVIGFLAKRAGFLKWRLVPYEYRGECYALRFGNDGIAEYHLLRYVNSRIRANFRPLFLFHASRLDDVLYTMFNCRKDLIAGTSYFLRAGETLDMVIAQANIEKDLTVNKSADGL